MSEQDEILLKRLNLLEHTALLLLNEVKGLRTHTDSSAYFLQIAVEDLLKAVQELKEVVTK